MGGKKPTKISLSTPAGFKAGSEVAENAAKVDDASMPILKDLRKEVEAARKKFERAVNGNKPADLDQLQELQGRLKQYMDDPKLRQLPADTQAELWTSLEAHHSRVSSYVEAAKEYNKSVPAESVKAVEEVGETVKESAAQEAAEKVPASVKPVTMKQAHDEGSVRMTDTGKEIVTEEKVPASFKRVNAKPLKAESFVVGPDFQPKASEDYNVVGETVEEKAAKAAKQVADRQAYLSNAPSAKARSGLNPADEIPSIYRKDVIGTVSPMKRLPLGRGDQMIGTEVVDGGVIYRKVANKGDGGDWIKLEGRQIPRTPPNMAGLREEVGAGRAAVDSSRALVKVGGPVEEAGAAAAAGGGGAGFIGKATAAFEEAWPSIRAGAGTALKFGGKAIGVVGAALAAKQLAETAYNYSIGSEDRDNLHRVNAGLNMYDAVQQNEDVQREGAITEMLDRHDAMKRAIARDTVTRNAELDGQLEQIIGNKRQHVARVAQAIPPSPTEILGLMGG